MKDRYSARIPVECSIIFSAETMIGEGRVIDVSLPGCLMEISESTRPGGYLRLKLSPLMVNLRSAFHLQWCVG